MAKTVCTTEYRPVLKGWSAKEKTTYLYQPGCKKWACPHCAARNKTFWIIKVAEGIDHYQKRGIDEWKFITITSHEKTRNLRQSLYVWPNAWAKLSRRIRYHFPGIRYVLLPEQHQDGRLHIHALASHGIPTRWVKDHGRKCGLGYKNQADEITQARQSVFYVTKYLNKSIADTNWPSGFRRIRTSQRWPNPEDQSEFQPIEIEWEYLTTYPAEGLEYLAEGLSERSGKKVKILK